MPDFDLLYPGRFLKGRALDKPRVIKIASAEPTKLEGDKGERSTCVMKFTAQFKIVDGACVETKTAEPGEIVWNKTNSILLAEALGERDYEKWAGHFVTIHFDPDVKFGSEAKGGIRVFGSPEMKKPRRVEIKRPRRKTPEVYDLHPTDYTGAIKSAPSGAA